MTIDALRSTTSTAQAAAQVDSDNSSAFREADFMAIMPAELSNQILFGAPQKPLAWWKMPRNCRNYPILALSATVTIWCWAQDLIGKGVTVSQNALSETEAQVLRDCGSNPDVGYGIVEGKVGSYRTIGENVTYRGRQGLQRQRPTHRPRRRY